MRVSLFILIFNHGVLCPISLIRGAFASSLPFSRAQSPGGPDTVVRPTRLNPSVLPLYSLRGSLWFLRAKKDGFGTALALVSGSASSEGGFRAFVITLS